MWTSQSAINLIKFQFKLPNNLISANMNPGHDNDSVDNRKICFTGDAEKLN